METIYESPEYFLQSQDLSESNEPGKDATVLIVKPNPRSTTILARNPQTVQQKKIAQTKKLYDIAQIILFSFSW